MQIADVDWRRVNRLTDGTKSTTRIRKGPRSFLSFGDNNTTATILNVVLFLHQMTMWQIGKLRLDVRIH